jgi:hypothetical protein
MPISTKSIAILNFLRDFIGLPSYERRETVGDCFLGSRQAAIVSRAYCDVGGVRGIR